MKKISLIGAGSIGGTIAHLLMSFNDVEVVLFDVKGGFAEGKALDLCNISSFSAESTRIVGTSDVSMISDSDIIVVTAGLTRSPGMSRGDVLVKNKDIIKSVAKNVKQHSPGSFVIIVTNPLDAMAYLFQKESGLSHEMVVGMAGVLDVARFKYFLSKEFCVSPGEIDAIILGCHGDTMVPLLRYTTISGIALDKMIDMGFSTKKKIDEIVRRTSHCGGEIVKLLGNGSAFYAPAASAVEMAKCYLFDNKKIVSTSCYLTGQYGFDDIYIGVPAMIGSSGVEQIIDLSLNEDESIGFAKSVDEVRSLLASL